MNLKTNLILLTCAGILTACATTNTSTQIPAVKTTLDNAVFKQMANAAYDAEEYAERESKFAALLSRDDLTQNQRAETYWYRGTIRGVYVNDGAYASPYCAVQDLKTMLTLAPDHPKKANALEKIAYQESRYKHFKQPETCGD